MWERGGADHSLRVLTVEQAVVGACLSGAAGRAVASDTSPSSRRMSERAMTVG